MRVAVFRSLTPPPPSRPQVRLGWATRDAELHAPVGCDVHGYSYRSASGSKVHAGLREGYGCGFSEGDVVGCLLHIPPGGRRMEKTPDGECRPGWLAKTHPLRSDRLQRMQCRCAARQLAG